MRHLDQPLTDETDLIVRTVAAAGAEVVELGCGKAEIARRLVERGVVRALTAFEVDAAQHTANLASAPPAGLRFALGGAQAVPLPDACCDGVLMLKSLHHVPVDLMDCALSEVRRILRPGGWLYVSEPVYAGPFNEIVRLFHDEGAARAAAYAALGRAAAAGLLAWTDEFMFEAPVHFRDFDDFVDRMVRVTHSAIAIDDALMERVRQRFVPHLQGDGAAFVREMRVNVLHRPA